MSKRDLVTKNREAILALAAKCGLENVRLFGSVARGDDTPESDVDLFVKRQPGSDPYLLLDFMDAMKALLGCKVDVLTEHNNIRPRLRESIFRDAVPV
jgi:uncharacterized protein